GILVDGHVRQRVQRGGLVHAVDGNVECSRHNVVACAAVVDGDRDGGGTKPKCDRRKGNRTGGAGAGVADGRVGNQPRIAGSGGDRERLVLVDRAGGDACEINGLKWRALVNSQVGQGIERGRPV